MALPGKISSEAHRHNATLPPSSHLFQDVERMKDPLGVKKKKGANPDGGAVHDAVDGCVVFSPSWHQASQLPSEPGLHSC